MNNGKKKCETLKAIRKQIAERYGLEYNPSECTFDGRHCMGTCPKCEEELRNLQAQLDKKGIKDIDLNVEIEKENNTIEQDKWGYEGNILDGEPALPTIPEPPLKYKQKKRILYKECQIAGITFHDLRDIWDELYEGVELALVRQKDNPHDKYAIAVALAEDYDGDPDDFDFDYILGYVPRTENEHLAIMMDLGWADAFECEISQVNGSNPYRGSLYMNIYLVSKEEHEAEKDTSHLFRVMELNEESFFHFTNNLHMNGCSYFRWGGYPPWEHNLPKKGDKIVVINKDEDKTTLFLMYCIAVGDDDAAYFTEEKDILHCPDDCCYYVLTNIKGPIVTQTKNLSFLSKEEINYFQPEIFLSEESTIKLRQIINAID